ncbi:protein of unknown function DUF37 [Stackebrandtia nassauensis DSM 44728]|uniref:Membrane protein insertion efficiency factor n=2 Tax=Stackebrandtia TaxID=283810 RepID=D3Q0H6_STANL|nr:protein of unknown function DUF37 [Stackebrandtia nassauensis DSM 44728]
MVRPRPLRKITTLMDDDTPEKRRTPLALTVTLASGGVVLLMGLVGGLLWLIWRPGTEPPQPQETSEPPRDLGDGADGGGGTAEPDTPENNDAEEADGGSEVDASGCDDDLSCDGPTCDSPSCETQSCDSPSCDSGTGVVSAGVSVMSVLPLVTVDRFTPRRPMRKRASVSRPARCGLAAIRGYRRWVSPRTRTRCRYVPSCSGYGTATIRSYGLANGSRLALRRIRRCTRSVPMGTVDPPP